MEDGGEDADCWFVGQVVMFVGLCSYCVCWYGKRL